MENKDNIYFKSTKVEMTDKYEKQVYLAMLAEQCSRYEDMMKFLEEMVNIRWFKFRWKKFIIHCI